MPAMWGDAIDVPEIMSQSRPKWNGGAVTVQGDPATFVRGLAAVVPVLHAL